MEDQERNSEITLLDGLGRRAACLAFEELDARGLALIRTAFVDTLGVALAGADFEGVKIARQAGVEPRPEGSVILGTEDRASVLDAGLLNGIAAHALDYDDGNAVMGGHPSAVLVPAVLALGEELNASAGDAFVGYAAGYEVIIRLSRGLNPEHYEMGWHPTSTIGVFGAAGAAARMLGLTPERTTVALAIAASMASGLKANFGSMTKALHVGQAVRNGLFAAKLAEGGYSAGRAAMEAEQGFLTVYNGAGRFNAQKILERLELGPEANRNINGIKAYPCCASTHSAVNAALTIRREHDPRLEAVAGIEIVVDRNRMPHTNRPRLEEALSGKFSLQYVVARALKDGGVGLDHFEGEAHRDPVIAGLMGRIRVKAAQGGVPNSFAADVSVTLRDGEVLHAHADRAARGRDGVRGEPEGLWEKFRDCAGRVMAESEVETLVATLEAFPERGDVRSLMALTARAAAQSNVVAESPTVPGASAA